MSAYARRNDTLATLAGVAFVMASVGAVHTLRGTLNRRFDSQRRVLDDASIPRPGVARVLSLGHTEWVTDVLWVNATIYYGETLFAHLPSRYTARYAETMIALDPQFRRPYMWAANALLYRTVVSTIDDARRATAFLKQGVQRFPGDPEMHYMLGSNLTFEQPTYLPRGDPERARLRREGVDHLRFAMVSGLGATWMPLTVSSIYREFGRERDALYALCDGLIVASDPGAYTLIETRLAELLRAQNPRDPVGDAFLEAARARRRIHLWMPPTLHAFVGEPTLLR